MKKRILAMMLAITVTLTMVPVTAYAEPATDTEESQEEVNQESEEENEELEETQEDIEPEAVEEETEENQEEIDTAGETGYNSVEFSLPEDDSTADNSEIHSYGGSLPSSYRVTTLVQLPTTRDQDSYETCWAFSSIASAEASFITKGLATSTLDLSEYQLAYFFYNHQNDPLGNTAGDSTAPIGATWAQRGGNNIFTMWALAGWQGAADEAIAPYTNLVSTSGAGTLSSSLAYNDIAHMQNAYILDITDTNKIKQAVITYGAVNAAYLHDDNYYNTTNQAYYNNTTSSGGGHAITIVGWDDSFSKSNFKAGNQPSSNGAWLVRNSWGSSWGSNGYFWMSYEDASLLAQQYGFVFDFESANNYTYNYQYDGSNSCLTYTISNGESLANTFLVKGSSEQKLSAVGIGLSSSNVNYSIQIYKNSSTTDPTSGTAMLTTPQTGTTGERGYHTIKLNQSIYFNPGEKLSVVFQLSKSGATGVSCFVDSSDDTNSWIEFENSTAAGQSFLNDSYYGWCDFNEIGACARIKAYTKTDNCLHTSTKQTITKANATKKTDGKIQTICRNCNEVISSTTISVPSKVKLSTTAYAYSGKAKKPSVKVYDKKGKLIASSNYTVKYASGRKNPGSYKVTVTFNSTNYTGSLSNTFRIAIGQPKVKASTQSTSSITLKWGKITGASKYTIYRYDTSKKKYIKIKTITNSDTVKYKDTGFKAGKTYQYKVRAYSKKFDSSGSYSAELKTCTKPKQVTNLKTSSKKKTSVKIKWTKVSGASGYQIYRYNTSKKKYEKIATISKGSTVSYTNSKLKSKKTYQYKVRAYRTAGDTKAYGSYSEVLSVKTK